MFRKNEELLILQKEKQTEIIHAHLTYMKTPFDGFGESMVGHDDVQCTRHGNIDTGSLNREYINQ